MIESPSRDIGGRGEDTAELRELLRQRTEALQALAYSVSHDLRAPVRAIAGFARMLLEGDSSKLPAETIRRLGVIEESAVRLQSMLDGILRVSRLEGADLQPVVVDMELLLDSVIASVRARYPGRQVEVVRGDLPPASGDPVLLRELFSELVDNAFKFTSETGGARVLVGCRSAGEGRATYLVRDNGAGFDDRYAGKLFGLYQRLHRADVFPGLGVGLAVSRAIVARHGGVIRAESQPGAGATFLVTLESPA